MGLLALVYMADHTLIASALDPSEVAVHLQLDLNPSGSRVVGVFNYPSKTDTACNGNCVIKKTGAWTRDPKGFMKCAVCGSRNRRVRRWLIGHLFDLLGANLMENPPAAFRTPEGYGLPPRRTDPE